MKFYVYHYADEKEYGPYEAEEVIEFLYASRLDWHDAIRAEEDDSWSVMGDYFDLEELGQ